MAVARARAAHKRTPPNAARAAQAAWLAYGRTEAGAPQIASLLVLLDAFKALDRPAQALGALDAIIERAPDEPRYKTMLADLRQSVGLLVRQVRTEPESDPPLACIEFTSPPSRRSRHRACRLGPLGPGSAGRGRDPARRRLLHRRAAAGGDDAGHAAAGLPGESGLTLKREVTLAVSMANRAPRLVFDQRLFLLPRNQAPRLSLASITCRPSS